MPWCPKCKNEYREGITVCADCGSPLVAEEELTGKASGILGEKRQDTPEPGQSTQEISGEYEDDFVEDTGENSPEKHFSRTESYAFYKKNAEKAEDNRSSAWTLLIVGALGLLVMILGIAGVLPFRIGNPYMFYGVMCTVFLLFIVMGFVSMKNAKVFAKKAESENSLIETLEEWCRNHLKAEDIDSEIAEEEDMDKLSEEILYFRRYEKLKAKLNHQFMNLDQALLDNLVDEKIYDMVFGK